MAQLDIRPIAAAETRPLRHAILRPHQPSDTLVYPGDDAADSLHAGAFAAGRLVGIASISRETLVDLPAYDAWRLRGMATLPEVRGQGYGAALIQACVDHIAVHGGNLLWCNGRTSALPFYRAVGFVPRGAEFIDPHTGPHYVMVRFLGAAHATEA